MKKLPFFAAFLFLLSSCAKLLAHDPYLEPALKPFFAPENIPNLAISKLSGGYSHAINYKIEAQSGIYVLRLYPSQEPRQEEIDKEFHMFCEASKRGAAPRVYGICHNKKGILTEFIEDEKLPLESIKRPETLKKMAAAIKRVHAISKHSHPTVDIIDKYEAIFQSLPKNTDTLSAMHLIKENVAALSIIGDTKINIHNELHPRNVFATHQRVLFLDWLDSTWADPFYDLSYFALVHDLNKREEALLLDFYLGREPTNQENERYHLTKKINLAGISLVLMQLSLASEITQEHESGNQKSWSHYVRIFADEKNALPAQFFYDWAVTALKYAQTL